MTGRTTLGLLVQTRNEHANIRDLSAIFHLFDDVLIADMESTDGTKEIALEAGARVLELPPAGYVEPGRQPAIDAMTTDWTLLLDADERVSKEAIDAARALVEAAATDDVSAFEVLHDTYLGDRKILGTGWGVRYEWHTRLFRRGTVTWPESVHSVPEVDGSVARVPEESSLTIEHRNFRDLEHALEKFNRYSSIEARELLARDEQPSALEGLVSGLAEFRRRYDPDTDGSASLALSLGMLLYRSMVHLKAAEQLGWPDEQLPDRVAVRGAVKQLVEGLRQAAAQPLGAPSDEEILLEQARIELADKIAQLDNALTMVEKRQGDRDAADAALTELRHQYEGLLTELAQSAAAMQRSAEAQQQVERELATLVRRHDRMSQAFVEVRAHLASTVAAGAVDKQTSLLAQARLAELEASAAMAALRRYRRGVERVAPPDSRRRRSYRGTLNVLRSIVGRRRPTRGTTVVANEPTMMADFAVPSSTAPYVSIVIPVHGQWSVTERCLRSIAAFPSDACVEVIVVDDASPDESREMLASVAGCRVVALDVNRGYIGATNAGIAEAQGSFVVLLNNDTEVTPGWLEALLDLAEADPTVGVVGAKLIYPNGVLQEAGGIIWDDATGWNYGRHGLADGHDYNYLRDVDYCSGACLLVRKDLLNQIGGLDDRYAPAYYDDTDLAFTARSLGYRVVYQPATTVIHHEGVSHGTDVGTGVKRYQEINRAVFAEKWAAALPEQYSSDPRNIRRAARRATKRGHVLVVDHEVPQYDRDSGSLRMTHLLKELVELGFSVTFLADNRGSLPPYTQRLQQMGIHVVHGHVDDRELVLSLADSMEFAILSRPSVAWRYLTMLRELAPRTKVIFDTVDLHHVREQRRVDLEGANSTDLATAWRELELGLVRACDVTLVVSPTEADVLQQECPGSLVKVVSNVHNARGDAAVLAGRTGMLFVGGFRHPPNADAVIWFVRDVLPLVHRQLPGAQFTIVGDSPPAEVVALAGPCVTVLGWVADLTPLHEAARVFVAPLRYGAGVKGKVGESLAMGLPVVSTRVGAEGMGLIHDVDVLVGDTAEDFAAEVVRAYEDDVLWTTLSAGGRERVHDTYSTQALRKSLASVLG